MAIHVEFYGIPRARAGVGRTSVLPERDSATLREVLEALAQRHREFAKTCLDPNGLRADFVMNVDGGRFVRDPETIVFSEQTVLILSADAGG